MLRELSVQNLALIEDVRVELQPGFCAWTGETGAGKSLLLTALGLLLGEKASAELIRAGKDEARVGAVIALDSDEALRTEVEEILGGPIEDDQLIVTRRITTRGRSLAHANGLPVPLSTLRQIGERLIDIHGQHEGTILVDPAEQRALLDAYAGLGSLLDKYRAARIAHETLRQRRIELKEAAERRERERDLLTFERDELAAADPKGGEHDELVREAHRLANVGELRAATTEGYSLLYEADRSVQGLLERVARRLQPLVTDVPELDGPVRELVRMAEDVREVARTLRRSSQSWEDDPDRLEEVETRLALYRRLSHRFRCEPDALADRRAEVERQIASLDQDDADLAGLDAPLAETWAQACATARQLSAGRAKACKTFSKAVQAELKDLHLEEAELEIVVDTTEPGDDPTAEALPLDGIDRVEIVFAPNPGEAPRPLRKIASGGELSRVMLAIKTVLAGADRVPTLVFDEIDTGVGGRLGAVLGRKLTELGRHHQIICVTHLPQMACHASHQWVIRKQADRGRTRTTIELLNESERVEELAAMLRGEQAAEGTRQEALAMLTEARGPRESRNGSRSTPARSRSR